MAIQGQVAFAPVKAGYSAPIARYELLAVITVTRSIMDCAMSIVLWYTIRTNTYTTNACQKGTMNRILAVAA